MKPNNETNITQSPTSSNESQQEPRQIVVVQHPPPRCSSLCGQLALVLIAGIIAASVLAYRSSKAQLRSAGRPMHHCSAPPGGTHSSRVPSQVLTYALTAVLLARVPAIVLLLSIRQSTVFVADSGLMACWMAINFRLNNVKCLWYLYS
jgi:hypothetical protein